MGDLQQISRAFAGAWFVVAGDLRKVIVRVCVYLVCIASLCFTSQALGQMHTFDGEPLRQDWIRIATQHEDILIANNGDMTWDSVRLLKPVDWVYTTGVAEATQVEGTPGFRLQGESEHFTIKQVMSVSTNEARVTIRISLTPKVSAPAH